MALIPNQPGLTAAVHPPSFNKFRMSGGADWRLSGGRMAGVRPASGRRAGGYPAAAYPAAYYSAHPELVAGGPRAAGGTAAAAGPQPIPVETTTYGEGRV